MSPRHQHATLTPSHSPNPSYLVLSELFGNDPVSRALYGRRAPDDCTPRAPVPASKNHPDGDDDDHSPSDGESLDLAIGILRTLLNEGSVTPDDVRRVARVLKRDSFGDDHGDMSGQKSATSGTEERVDEQTREEREEAAIVTDDESGTGKSSNPTSSSIMARREPPRRESSVRKLNPPKKRRSVAKVEGCQ